MEKKFILIHSLEYMFSTLGMAPVVARTVVVGVYSDITSRRGSLLEQEANILEA